ncbi:MAG: hypothetical protein ACYC0X_26445 [Pirellulaceae bacterium]
MNVEIEELDFGNGDTAYGVVLPITPYGEAYFVAPDVSMASEGLLRELGGVWHGLWPDMLSSMQEGAKQYSRELLINPDEFIGSVQHLDADVFMGDKADLMIAVRPNEQVVPQWHFFVRGSKILHFQPVF